ncbi:hypothetical protein C8J57DRAFT_1295890, partial [Mycena rebaudengoi]
LSSIWISLVTASSPPPVCPYCTPSYRTVRAFSDGQCASPLWDSLHVGYNIVCSSILSVDLFTLDRPQRCSSLRAERIPCPLQRSGGYSRHARCASTPKLALAARHKQNRLRYSRYVPVLSFVSSCTVRYSHILFRIISIPSTFRTCRTDCNFFLLSFHLSYSCGQSTIFTGIYSCKLAHSVTVYPSQPAFCSALSRICG